MSGHQTHHFTSAAKSKRIEGLVNLALQHHADFGVESKDNSQYSLPQNMRSSHQAIKVFPSS